MPAESDALTGRGRMKKLAARERHLLKSMPVRNWGTYMEPNYFLSLYVTGSGQNDAGWTDETYDALLAGANRTLDAGVCMRKLAECEYRLMAAMPVLPPFYKTWTYLQKRFVRG